MANQAIALGARAPQTDILGGAIQRNAQMMNMMAQQRAAERQAAVAQQEMQLKQTKETREADAAAIELAMKRFNYHRELGNAVAASGNPQTYAAWLEGVKQDSPQIATLFAQAMPVDRFDPTMFDRMLASVEQRVNKTYATPVASVGYDKGGAAYNMVAGGMPGVAGAYQMQEFALDPNAAAGAAPSGATPPPYQAPSAPATDEAIDAAAKAIAGGAKITDPAIRDLTPNDLKRAQDKAMKGVLAQPIAFNPAEGMGVVDLTVENAPQIVQAAMQNGMIDQKHVEQLRQIVGPENDQALASWMRQNNVRIQPTGEASFRSAVYRPGGEDMLQEAQYRATGRQFVGRDPNQSPLPGSSQVPLPRVAAEARAQRETPQEVYAKELAKARAARDIGPKPLSPVQEAKLRDNITKDWKSTQSTLNMMLDPKSGVIASVNAVRKLSPAQKEAITGWSGYAPSITASSRSADTVVKNLRGKVTEMGKAAASLTGAIGQMAVQEWKIVSDMIASLDLEGMEPADLDNQLDIIESAARRAAAVTKDAYNNQYVEEFDRYPGRFQLSEPSGASAPASQGGNMPRIRTDAEYARLKSGALFIDPNGKTRRKP